MNIDRGKTYFSPEEQTELQQRAKAYKEDKGWRWPDFEKATGVNNKTLSVWVTGKYPAAGHDIAHAIFKFFQAEELREEMEKQKPIVPGFQMTRTARRIHSNLTWARQGKMVVIIGDPGVGKTASLDQWTSATPNAWKMTVSPTTAALSNLLRVTASTVLGSFCTIRSGVDLSQTIRDRVHGASATLIFDEAQHMEERALEELRSIHDETGCGLVFCGNREVLRRVEGRNGREAAFAQRFSRVAGRMLIDRPEPEDIEVLLNAWDITHPAERKYLRDIALRPGGGGLRTLSNTLEYATLVAQADQDESRNLSHIKDAFAQLTARPGEAA